MYAYMDAYTSLRIRTKTRMALEEVKTGMETGSFDETIANLIADRNRKLSLFGADKSLKPWNRKTDRAGFDNEDSD